MVADPGGWYPPEDPDEDDAELDLDEGPPPRWLADAEDEARNLTQQEEP